MSEKLSRRMKNIKQTDKTWQTDGLKDEWTVRQIHNVPWSADVMGKTITPKEKTVLSTNLKIISKLLEILKTLDQKMRPMQQNYVWIMYHICIGPIFVLGVRYIISHLDFKFFLIFTPCCFFNAKFCHKGVNSVF